jgi:hypothetical protein
MPQRHHTSSCPSGSSSAPCYPNAGPITLSRGCHRTRIRDRVIFEKLVQVLVFGCAYRRISDKGCSATILRRRRDEWMELGAMDALQGLVRQAYDQIVGLELCEVVVDCCVTKAPCGGEKAGRSPVDRGKRGTKRSVAVDAKGIPLGIVTAPANRHDTSLLPDTLDTGRESGLLPEGASVRPDRGYDSQATRRKLWARGLLAEISEKGKAAPVAATGRWIVERTNSWHNAHKKLVWCTGRSARVVEFWVAFSSDLIIVARLVREAWIRYRWEGRPLRRP